MPGANNAATVYSHTHTHTSRRILTYSRGARETEFTCALNSTHGKCTNGNKFQHADIYTHCDLPVLFFCRVRRARKSWVEKNRRANMHHMQNLNARLCTFCGLLVAILPNIQQVHNIGAKKLETTTVREVQHMLHHGICLVQRAPRGYTRSLIVALFTVNTPFRSVANPGRIKVWPLKRRRPTPKRVVQPVISLYALSHKTPKPKLELA